MQKRFVVASILSVAAMVLFAGGAMAQSAPAANKTKPHEDSSKQPADRKSGSVVAADFDHRTARETGSGMATGRRQYQPLTTRESNGDQSARDSAHATESVDGASMGKNELKQEAENKAAGQNKMSSAQNNPMYKDSGKSGANPLYEGKDKAAAAPAPKSHETVEYKDGEDMTTRYRPGNNKTTRTSNPKPAGSGQ